MTNWFSDLSGPGPLYQRLADRIESGIVRTVCLYFDTKPRQITFGVSNREIPASREGLERALTEHRAYILNELLPRIGARNVQSSDFER